MTIVKDIKDSDLEDLLKHLSENMDKSADKSRRIASFNDLFAPTFMTLHTQFSNFNELLNAGKFNVKSLDDFNAILNNEFDEFLDKTTKFKNWEEMQSTAVAEFFKKEQ